MHNRTFIIYRNKTLLLILLLVTLLTSCKVLKPHKFPDVTTDPKLFRDLSVTDTSNMASIPWKSFFTDPRLQALIDEAVKNNQDLQIAMVRMKKAEASLRQSRAAFLPSLTVGAEAMYQNDNTNGLTVPRAYEIYGSSSWEIDIWGKLRNTKKANLAAFLESEAYKRAVQTRLIANVAISYYTLLAYDAQLQITQKTLAKREADVEAMTLLKNTDVVTGADLVLSEANRYSTEVIIPDIKQNIFQTENALCLFLGRNPGPVDRDSLFSQKISADIKYGVPAQMLANRPDVQEAEYSLRYYYHMTKAARSYFYPALTLTASGGMTSTDLSALFNTPTLIWNVIGGLAEPLLNYGLNKQRLRAAEADEEESLIAFKQKVLQAGNEVVNAMNDYKTASDKISIRVKQIDYLEKSVDYTMELLKYTSTTNYTDVLTAEENLLSAQLNGVNDKLQQLKAVVDLYQSVGGGWKQ